LEVWALVFFVSFNIDDLLSLGFDRFSKSLSLYPISAYLFIPDIARWYIHFFYFFSAISELAVTSNFPHHLIM